MKVTSTGKNIVSEAKNQNKMTTNASMRFTEIRKARAGVVLENKTNNDELQGQRERE